LNLVTANPGADSRHVLEIGDILFFPPGVFSIPPEILAALTGAAQDTRAIHKNIAYKPAADKISGLAGGEEASRVREAMRAYSRLALGFISRVLPEYGRSWKVDYASFRSIEERGRELPLNKRNDLLHVDAFPTRPVFGDLILRCFTNVNPDQSREWMTSDPFEQLASREAASAGIDRYAALARSRLHAVRRAAARGMSAAGLPVVDRSPYDAFMLHMHAWMKANQEYQRSCPKYRFELPPGSTWMVFTDVVPHAVLGGRLALEQTVIVSRSSLADPRRAPASILEKIAGVSLVN
jgi:hypothetical protein